MPGNQSKNQPKDKQEKNKKKFTMSVFVQNTSDKVTARKMTCMQWHSQDFEVGWGYNFSFRSSLKIAHNKQ